MENKSTNEINLVDIFVAIGKWLKNALFFLLNYFGGLLRLIYRKKILIGSIMLLFFIASQYFARPSARIYKVDAMGTLYGVEASTVLDIGKQLSQSSPRFSATSLASKLNIPDSVAKKVAGIGFYYVIDYLKDNTPDVVDFHRNHSLKDTLNVRMRNHVYIRLKTIGINHAQEVGKAVLNYINSNHTALKDLETSNNLLREQIRLCDVEMSRLDSLSNITYFKEKTPEIKFENNKLLVGNNSVQLFYGDLLQLQRIKAAAQTRLEEAEQPLVVPAGFVVNPNSVNGRLKSGVFGLIYGFFAGLILSYILENIKKWLKYLSGK